MDTPEIDHDKRMAMQAQIDNALKALGQGEMLNRVEELECIIAECLDAMRGIWDPNHQVLAAIARRKEALK